MGTMGRYGWGPGPQSHCWLKLDGGCGKLSKEGGSQPLFYLHVAESLPSESSVCPCGPARTSSWENKQYSGRTGKPVPTRIQPLPVSCAGGQRGAAPRTSAYRAQSTHRESRLGGNGAVNSRFNHYCPREALIQS